ncbi:MAG: hypothetical protein IT165_19525 [Bryobacterales bacterium]|nr:hypothetical protein [Bryobacterales bacterium]
MAVIIRLDIDRPYGRRPLARHLLSRLSSDLYFPAIEGLGYLAEVRTMLTWLNAEGARAYVFFRRCTLPSPSILELLDAGRHEISLHLENSRSYGTFLEETRILERHTKRKVSAMSKHGSGEAKFGFHHYAPYEPEKYVQWAQQASLRVFLGNLEDPSLEPEGSSPSLLFFPSAFWLEPHWRDTQRFPVDWLLDHARHRDIVLLVHPENVLADPGLVTDFRNIIRALESRIVS